MFSTGTCFSIRVLTSFQMVGFQLQVCVHDVNVLFLKVCLHVTCPSKFAVTLFHFLSTAMDTLMGKMCAHSFSPSKCHQKRLKVLLTKTLALTVRISVSVKTVVGRNYHPRVSAVSGTWEGGTLPVHSEWFFKAETFYLSLKGIVELKRCQRLCLHADTVSPVSVSTKLLSNGAVK